MLRHPHGVIMLHSCHMQYIAQESVRLVMNMDRVLANTTGIVQWPCFANVLCAISSGIVTCCTAEMTAIRFVSALRLDRQFAHVLPTCTEQQVTGKRPAHDHHQLDGLLRNHLHVS